MTTPKQAPDQKTEARPTSDAHLPHLLGEMAALWHMLPGAVPHPSTVALPDDAAVEAGFDNMPV